MSDNTAPPNLAELLSLVSMNASKMNASSLQKILPFSSSPQQTSSDDQKKNTHANQNSNLDFSKLPPQFKQQVLRMLDDPVLESAYGGNPEDRLEKCTFLDKLTTEEALSFFSKEKLQSLENEGYFFVDSFLGDQNLISKVIAEASALSQSDVMRPASMAQGTDKWNESAIRGDKLIWLNNRSQFDQSKTSNLFRLLDRMETLRIELNNACDFESDHSQTQLATYSNGARYVRHLDASKKGSTRRITCLYYMNRDWQESHGGCLRIYTANGKTKDIAPLADRLLVFQSRTLEHEVLPAHQPRLAVTMWFY